MAALETDDLHVHLAVGNVENPHRTQAALIVQECRATRVHEKYAVRPLDGRPVLVAEDNYVRQYTRLLTGREGRLAKAIWSLVNEPHPVPLDRQHMLRLNAPISLHREYRIIIAEGCDHGGDRRQIVEDARKVNIAGMEN